MSTRRGVATTVPVADPKLSALDSEMGGLWFAYSRFPFLMGANGVRHDEARQFLDDRAACAADVACLRQLYDARIAALQDGQLVGRLSFRVTE